MPARELTFIKNSPVSWWTSSHSFMYEKQLFKSRLLTRRHEIESRDKWKEKWWKKILVKIKN